MPKLSNEIIEELIDVLRDGCSEYYDDPNGPRGNECSFCLVRSNDLSSSPVHYKDCQGIRLIRALEDAVSSVVLTEEELNGRDNDVPFE